MRCVGQRENAKRHEFIRNNRRQVDPYAGLLDLLEIIRVLHTPRKFDQLITYAPPPKPIEQLYDALSPEQAQKLVDIALDTNGTDLSEDIARSLAILTDHDISRLQSAWVEAGEFWPAVIFRNSPAVVRDQIIRSLDSCDGGADKRLSVNHALCALAWIGDQTTQQKFAEWQRQPLSWRDSLHVGPNGYAHTAGWELHNDRRRDLFYRECWAIVSAAADAPVDASITTFAPALGSCPWCHRPLAHLIEINLNDPRFAFLKIDVPSLAVLTCDACTCYSEHIFAHVGEMGATTWHESNTTPSYLPEDNKSLSPNPWREHSCELVRRRPMQSVEGSPVDASQIGGLPGWVQDSAYPSCPDCGETMRFIAQLDNSRFSGYEGVYYAFLCACCRVTATGYQQT